MKIIKQTKHKTIQIILEKRKKQPNNAKENKTKQQRHTYKTNSKTTNKISKQQQQPNTTNLRTTQNQAPVKPNINKQQQQ